MPDKIMRYSDHEWNLARTGDCWCQRPYRPEFAPTRTHWTAYRRSIALKNLEGRDAASKA